MHYFQGADMNRTEIGTAAASDTAAEIVADVFFIEIEKLVLVPPLEPQGLGGARVMA